VIIGHGLGGRVEPCGEAACALGHGRAPHYYEASSASAYGGQASSAPGAAAARKSRQRGNCGGAEIALAIKPNSRARVSRGVALRDGTTGRGWRCPRRSFLSARRMRIQPVLVGTAAGGGARGERENFYFFLSFSVFFFSFSFFFFLFFFRFYFLFSIESFFVIFKI
jgi:hypothetical protein